MNGRSFDDSEFPQISRIEDEPTETIDLGTMFTQDVSETGSFDIRTDIWATTFGKVIQALPIPAFLLDSDSDILYANQACSRISPEYGKTLGSNFSQLFPSAASARKIQMLIDSVRSERKPIVDEAIMEMAGTKIWARMTLRSVRLMRERYILLLVENLTREKKQLRLNEKLKQELEKRVSDRTSDLEKANERLKEEILVRRQSEEKYRTILETMADGYHETDLAGNLTLFNHSVCEVIGYSSEQLLGKNYRDLVDEATAKRVFEAYNKVCKTGIPNKEFSFEAIAKDGAKRDISVSIAPIPGADGKPTGFRGILRDITERKKLEEQIRQSSKMEAIGRLAGGIAHDFNNLLTAVMGYSDILMQQTPSDSAQFGKLVQISRAAKRAASLTRELLAFSRKQVLEVKMLDLNEVLSGLGEMLHRLIGEDISLKTVYSPDLGCVKADPGQIEQVVMNLVVNARDAMRNGGTLVVETANVHLDYGYTRSYPDVRPGSYVMLGVTDSGHGMDSGTLSHVFDPFFTTKPKGVGTGLGLATVYGIVKQHNGHISVYSELGKGTSLKVYLPRAEGVPEPTSVIVVPDTRSRGHETILVVEDEDAVRTLACEALDMLGYAPLEARDPKEAEKVCQDHQGPIHLLLTDVVLPLMDGRSLFNRLSPARPDMRVLYVSGYTENFIQHHGVLDAGLDFLAKPFSIQSLALRIREILDAR